MSGANGGVERSETVPGPELPRSRQEAPRRRKAPAPEKGASAAPGKGASAESAGEKSLAGEKSRSQGKAPQPGKRGAPEKRGAERGDSKKTGPSHLTWSRSFLGGEIGIRTLNTLLGYTRFPIVPLQPLEHLSKKALQI